MAESSTDFGAVDAIGAEAIGQPGQRTFRLIARVGGVYASLWMEKEQLLALGTSLQQQIVRLGRPAARTRTPLLDGSEVPPTPEVQFHCGQLGLGYDEAGDQFVILAYPTDAGENDVAAWSGRVSLGQARALSRQIEQLVESGRPKCPLCGAIMDGLVHVCPRANGHARELTNG